jgi:DNA polymerase-3 subunit gamma/tau
LARKYRPRTFEDLIGQTQVGRTLTRALEVGRLAHAYLFAGPRGVGKTTAARLLSMALSCTDESKRPCGVCESCREIQNGSSVDVVEVDGASNRGINEIRSLRETVKFLPIKNPRKVYIIDEVHALTNEAFNALLKTLEEPPAHVVFIFATTEAHKLPATILSRCQRFDFRRIKVEEIVKRLQQVATAENIQYADDALVVIARQAGGGLRDALGLLDQVLASSPDITLEAVNNALGLINQELVEKTVVASLRGNLVDALNILDEAYDLGYDFKELGLKVLELTRNCTLFAAAPGMTELLDLTDAEAVKYQEICAGLSLAFLHRHLEAWLRFQGELSRHPHPRWLLESHLIRLCQMAPVGDLAKLTEKLATYLESGGAPPAESVGPPVKSLASPISQRREMNQKAVETTSPPTSKAEADKAQADQTQAAKTSVDQVQAEKAQADKAEADKTQVEKAQVEKAQADKAEADKAQADKAQADKAQADKAEADKIQAEKAQADKAEADKAEADKAEADKTQAERTSVDQAQVDKTPEAKPETPGEDQGIAAPIADVAAPQTDFLAEPQPAPTDLSQKTEDMAPSAVQSSAQPPAQPTQSGGSEQADISETEAKDIPATGSETPEEDDSAIGSIADLASDMAPPIDDMAPPIADLAALITDMAAPQTDVLAESPPAPTDLPQKEEAVQSAAQPSAPPSVRPTPSDGSEQTDISGTEAKDAPAAIGSETPSEDVGATVPVAPTTASLEPSAVPKTAFPAGFPAASPAEPVAARPNPEESVGRFNEPQSEAAKEPDATEVLASPPESKPTPTTTAEPAAYPGQSGSSGSAADARASSLKRLLANQARKDGIHERSIGFPSTPPTDEASDSTPSYVSQNSNNDEYDHGAQADDDANLTESESLFGQKLSPALAKKLDKCQDIDARKDILAAMPIFQTLQEELLGEFVGYIEEPDITFVREDEEEEEEYYYDDGSEESDY